MGRADPSKAGRMRFALLYLPPRPDRAAKYRRGPARAAWGLMPRAAAAQPRPPSGPGARRS